MGLSAAACCSRFRRWRSCTGTAPAQDFPNRPITLMVPLAPGGGMDFIARTIGAEAVGAHRQAGPGREPAGRRHHGRDGRARQGGADGYTLLLVPGSTLTTNATVYKSLPYDPRKDFVPVALTSQVAFPLVVNPSLPVQSVAELIKYAKDKPGELIVGTVRHRHHDASRRRAARPQDRHQAPLRALPRQPAGDERRDRRPRPHDVRRPGDRRGACQGRQGARAGGDVEEPARRLSGACRRSRRPAFRATRRPTGTC